MPVFLHQGLQLDDMKGQRRYSSGPRFTYSRATVAFYKDPWIILPVHNNIMLGFYVIIYEDGKLADITRAKVRFLEAQVCRSEAQLTPPDPSTVTSY